jgi:Zn finger protein HypA/HybF involved in hydrogenase expression
MPPATEKPVKREFANLPCLGCGNIGSVQVILDDLTIRCPECDSEWQVSDLRVTILAWQQVLVWLETAPVRE